MATVFYNDSSGPTAYTGTRNIGIAGIQSFDSPRVTYALYEDSATWSAWTAWAQSNALNTNNIENFSARALEVYGNWQSINETEFSFMCVEDESTESNMGAWCAEAYIDSSTGQRLYDTRTWRLSATDVTTKLDAYAPDDDRSLKSFAFDSTSVTSPALTEIEEVVTSVDNYKSF